MPLGFARNAGLLAGGGGALDWTASGHSDSWTSSNSVSYTHLTLPTKA